MSTGRDSLLFSPSVEEEKGAGEEGDNLQEGRQDRLTGMSQAARAVMGLDKYDEIHGRAEVDFELKVASSSASETAAQGEESQALRAKPRAPKRKVRPRELQDIPDAPLELTAKEIKASLADTSSILRRNPSDQLPILRRPRPAHGRGVTSRICGDFIGADADTERPDEVVCIGGRHEAFFASRFGSTAVPTITQLGLPSVRGLCPELQEVFRMTMSTDDGVLSFPPSKKRREEMMSLSATEKGAPAAVGVVPEVEEEEVELARDRASMSSLSVTGRPSILGEQGRKEVEEEKFEHGVEIGGAGMGIEGFSMDESIELPGKTSFGGARMSDISFSSGVLGGFEEALLHEEEVGKSRIEEEAENAEEEVGEKEKEEGRARRFQPVGAKGRGELSPAAAKDNREGHWNNRTSTVYKALNKRLENKVCIFATIINAQCTISFALPSNTVP